MKDEFATSKMTNKGYLVLGFLPILDEKSRFGDRPTAEVLKLMFGKLNSPGLSS